MADQNTTDDQFAGFSSDELLRRARVLREIAETDKWERGRLVALAEKHEDAARRARGIPWAATKEAAREERERMP